MRKFKLDCGCEIDLLNEGLKDEDGLPSLNIDFYNLKYDCPKTWQLLNAGDTVGIFQLENSLGQNWTKQVEPTCLGDIAALTSLLRPGCLKAIIDGKSMTQHYADRKRGEEDIEYLHESIQEILAPTYGVLCVEENTFISLATGHEQQIKNLVPNTEIETINDKKYIQIEKCNNVLPSKTTNGYELILSNGYRVILTNDHKVLTQDGMIKLEELDINYHVIGVAVNQTNIKQYDKIADWLGENSPISYLFGQLVGDGCSGWSIAAGTEEKADKIIAFLSRYLPKITTYKYFNVRCWYVSLSCEELLNDKKYGNRKTKFRLLLEQNTLNNTGLSKNIPQFIYSSSDEVICSFLAGLFDSDGYCGTDTRNNAICTFCSSNPETINGIRKLLNILKIKNYISPDFLHIIINDVTRFNNIIGPYLVLNTIKGKKTKAITYGDYPWISIKKYFIEKYGSVNTGRKAVGLSKRYTRVKMPKFVQYRTALKSGIISNNNDICYVKIKSIKLVGIKNFYSISVENTHNFIGNGIILSNCYQEQSMAISRIVAGFNLQQADSLRKSMGKKDAKLMAKVKTQFLDGAKTANIVSEEKASEIFGAIEKSNRYAFNRSHAVQYSIITCWAAWVKAHFPLHFYTVWLDASEIDKGNDNQRDTIDNIASDAKMHGIKIYPPQIDKEHFSIVNRKNIQVGLNGVKTVKENAILDILEIVRTAQESKKKSIQEFTWWEILTTFSGNLKRDSFINLITVGTFLGQGMTRQEMLYQHSIWDEVTVREKGLIPSDSISSLNEALRFLINENLVSKSRLKKIVDLLKLLENPTMLLEDGLSWVTSKEEELIGLPISCSRLDNINTSMAKCTCKEYVDGKSDDLMFIAEVTNARIHIIKSGQNKGKRMGIFNIRDKTGKIPCIMFTDKFEKFKDLIFNGNVLSVYGKRSDKDSLMVMKVSQL